MTLAAEKPVIVLAGDVYWDGPWGTQQHLADALSAHFRVLFAEVPVSITSPLRDRARRPIVRTQKPGEKRFPFPVPDGWFVVAESRDLDPGQTMALYVFGRDVVLFRTESGEARMVDVSAKAATERVAIAGWPIGLAAWTFFGAEVALLRGRVAAAASAARATAIASGFTSSTTSDSPAAEISSAARRPTRP